MANNINQATRKKQLLLATLIGGAIVIAGGTIFYAKGIQKSKNTDTIEHNEPELEPDLTGSVNNTFEGSVASQVVSDAQAQNRESREALDKVMGKLEEIQTQLEEQKKENEELKKRIADDEQNHLELMSKVAENSASITPQSSEPIPSGVSAQRNKLNYGNEAYNSQPVQNGVIQLDSPKVVKGSFERKVYSTKKEGSSSGRFYVPSGAFSNAIILEGADANAAVTAQQNNVAPMQFKLTGKLHLPANEKNNKLSGCFVTAGTYGDISSERAIVRLNRLSCVINGKHVDQEVKGHVAFYGKNGIKGEPVMRNGKILGLAFASGALGGIGSAISAVGDTQAGLGATRTIGGSEVAREALGGGTTTAANKLADYYIQRAEQYHPVIPIGSANRVEVVFTEGFWAEFVEDKDEGQIKATLNVRRDGEPEPVSSTNLTPKELQNQLGEIGKQSLNDFVTPNEPNSGN